MAFRHAGTEPHRYCVTYDAYEREGPNQIDAVNGLGMQWNLFE